MCKIILNLATLLHRCPNGTYVTQGCQVGGNKICKYFYVSQLLPVGYYDRFTNII